MSAGGVVKGGLQVRKGDGPAASTKRADGTGELLAGRDRQVRADRHRLEAPGTEEIQRQRVGRALNEDDRTAAAEP